MRQEESLSESSLEEDSLISRATPKRSEPHHPNSMRSRFTILSDMNETNPPNKKGQEQSLLSKYLKQLHEEQKENQIRSANSQKEQKELLSFHEAKHLKQSKENEVSDVTWKKKSGKYRIEEIEAKSKPFQFENSRMSKIENEGVGIFVYRRRIDLNLPIDFQIIEKENVHRNCAQSRNSSKVGLRQDEGLFGVALKNKNRSSKC